MPKRAFTLINPQTMHQIKRVDDVPLNNEMDYFRHRLTENRKFEWLTRRVRRSPCLGVKNIPIETDVLIIGVRRQERPVRSVCVYGFP